jgi:hypothetical protein
MRPAKARAPTLLMALLVGVLPVGIAQVDDPVQEIDALTLQWTGLEHQKDLLQANWRTQKPVLEQQLSLLERETRELNEFLATFARQQDEVEQRRLELLEEQTRLEQEQAALERSLVQASLKLRALHSELPPPLLEAWTEELPGLDNLLLTPSEKLQLVLELLRQLDDFEQKITLHETVMTLADGRDYSVTQVYLGLSHGWYVTADQRFAAEGMAGPGGWLWTPVTDGGPIADIVDILERRLDPDLVSIPLKLNVQSAAGGD